MQPKHLLIIDDEDQIREVASLSLERRRAGASARPAAAPCESRWQNAAGIGARPSTFKRSPGWDSPPCDVEGLALGFPKVSEVNPTDV